MIDEDDIKYKWDHWCEWMQENYNKERLSNNKEGITMSGLLPRNHPTFQVSVRFQGSQQDFDLHQDLRTDFELDLLKGELALIPAVDSLIIWKDGITQSPTAFFYKQDGAFVDGRRPHGELLAGIEDGID